MEDSPGARLIREVEVHWSVEALLPAVGSPASQGRTTNGGAGREVYKYNQV